MTEKEKGEREQREKVEKEGGGHKSPSRKKIFTTK